jgi:L-threonylcarbamoyladenylate synthase
MLRRMDDAVRALSAGKLVVYPTDTVLGLAARASDARAVARLASAKQRPHGQPISVSVSSLDELERIARLSCPARQFVRRHLPGPVTVLVRPDGRARRSLAPAIAGGPTLGVRVPDHPVARELCRRAGPITATSANRHGDPPTRTVAEARRVFGSRVAVYLAARPRPSGHPSMLVDLTGAVPRPVSRR